MSGDTDHGYGWKDLRKRPAGELAVGDTWVNPGLGATYYESRDGRVWGTGWAGPEGIAWTVTARDGDLVTARSHDGRELAQEIPADARMLVVEPKGTVLVVKSHRAWEQLERALGRTPAGFYDKGMRRGGKFVVLYGPDVDTALSVKSVTRTRLTVDDVALCIGVDGDSRHAADRAAGRKAGAGA